MTANIFDLTGKVAIVTGTSRGLGQYFGRALARAGADLVITARDAASLAPFQAEIEALGRRAVPLPLDVRDYDSIQRMVEGPSAAYGKIDILVNNAGCNVRKPALESPGTTGTWCSTPTCAARSSSPRPSPAP